MDMAILHYETGKFKAFSHYASYISHVYKLFSFKQ